MRMNKLGNILIPETEYELIWFAIWEWNYLEQIKSFNEYYDEYRDMDFNDNTNPIVRRDWWYY